jgi:putative transposase
MQLPAGDQRYSLRLKQIKAEFSDQWLEAGLPEADVTESNRRRIKERQRRRSGNDSAV